MHNSVAIFFFVFSPKKYRRLMVYSLSGASVDLLLHFSIMSCQSHSSIPFPPKWVSKAAVQQGFLLTVSVMSNTWHCPSLKLFPVLWLGLCMWARITAGHPAGGVPHERGAFGYIFPVFLVFCPGASVSFVSLQLQAIHDVFSTFWTLRLKKIK